MCSNLVINNQERFKMSSIQFSGLKIGSILNSGKKVVRKPYEAPELRKVSISTKSSICDSRDMAMDRWERTHGNPSREWDDVSMYLPNGQYISRSGEIKG